MHVKEMPLPGIVSDNFLQKLGTPAIVKLRRQPRPVTGALRPAFLMY